jgi:acyl-CoA synthetase (NDP forming)
MSESWLDKLLDPRSVAVVGGSDDMKAPGGRVLRFMLSFGFKGDIYPVNPKRDVVQKVRAYSSVADLPASPDLAVIVVPAAAAVDALRQCGERGVPVVLVGSAGFAEAGPEGVLLQAELKRIATQYGIRLFGPNTNGIINVRNGLVASFTPAMDQDDLKLNDGPVAIVSQSGAIGGALFYDAQRSGLAVGRLLNTGNELDISMEMVVDALSDPGSRITTILCYVEGLRRPEAFVQAARRAARNGKRIVLLKAGVTAAGAKAAAAHTASLAGEDRVYDGVLGQLGVARARSMTHLLDVGRVLAAHPRGIGRRASVASLSGGVGIMLTDALERAGMRLAAHARDVQQAIDPLLPPFLGRDNPLDLGGSPFHHLDRLRSILQILDDNPDSDFSILGTGGFERRQLEIADVLIDQAGRLKKPLFVVWFGGGDLASHRLNSAGVGCFPDAERLVAAIAPAAAGAPPRVAAYGATADPAAEIDGEAARALLDAARSAGRKVIDEVGAKHILAAYGIDTVAERVVAAAEECAAALHGLRFPVVAKLRSDELVHKARVGGVRLGLATAEAARAAVSELLALARRLGLGTADVVLQEEIPAGVELLLGMKRDATFGPVIMLGIGGVLTEAWDDVQIRLAECDGEVPAMLAALRHRQVLQGAGGKPAVDAADIAPTVARFARLVRDVGQGLDAIDVNPLIVRAGGAGPVVVDAVFFLRN